MKKITPIKAIRAKCIDCCGGSVYEPKYCTISSCPLYAYRLGHRPKDEIYIPPIPKMKQPPRSYGVRA